MELNRLSKFLSTVEVRRREYARGLASKRKKYFKALVKNLAKVNGVLAVIACIKEFEGSQLLVVDVIPETAPLLHPKDLPPERLYELVTLTDRVYAEVLVANARAMEEAGVKPDDVRDIVIRVSYYRRFCGEGEGVVLWQRDQGFLVDLSAL
ncbi:hypothetical protein [Pyrococcus kukulkanii]|uniref:Uncharacterized protein n=1 Tax=Pyrococcus kukulkanii TaxID=1609559 RepID=A0ABV4T5J0_9EURY